MKGISSKKKYLWAISILAIIILIAASIAVSAAVMEKEMHHYKYLLKISESKDILEKQESAELRKLTNLGDEDIKVIASKYSTGNITKIGINEEGANVFFTVKVIDGAVKSR